MGKYLRLPVFLFSEIRAPPSQINFLQAVILALGKHFKYLHLCKIQEQDRGREKEWRSHVHVREWPSSLEVLGWNGARHYLASQPCPTP